MGNAPDAAAAAAASALRVSVTVHWMDVCSMWSHAAISL